MLQFVRISYVHEEMAMEFHWQIYEKLFFQILSSHSVVGRIAMRNEPLICDLRKECQQKK